MRVLVSSSDWGSKIKQNGSDFFFFLECNSTASGMSIQLQGKSNATPKCTEVEIGALGDRTGDDKLLNTEFCLHICARFKHPLCSPPVMEESPGLCPLEHHFAAWWRLFNG